MDRGKVNSTMGLNQHVKHDKPKTSTMELGPALLKLRSLPQRTGGMLRKTYRKATPTHWSPANSLEHYRCERQAVCAKEGCAAADTSFPRNNEWALHRDTRHHIPVVLVGSCKDAACESLD
eukprot:6461079-Amphidinium_carterae.3